MYKGINPKKHGRRMFRTSYKAIFPEEDKPSRAIKSDTPESGEVLQSGPKELPKKIVAAPSLTQGQS